MAESEPKYDVALSFLSADEPIAAAISNRLSEGIEVFFYPRRQEEIAGTDGLESMRTPFLDDSRVVVVLYKTPWGETPWTRVEKAAILDGCLKHGWRRLFFVVLDKESTLPVWLPATHVWFDYDSFGLEQAVGAIKARVQESGGEIRQLTVSRRAELYEEEAAYVEEKKRMTSGPGLQAVQAKVSEVFAEIERHCAELQASGKIPIRVGSGGGRCVLTNNSVSLIVSWHPPYVNALSTMNVSEYNAHMPLPNEPHPLFVEEKPTQLTEKKFLAELSRAREYGWAEESNPSRFLSSSKLAEQCVIQFINLAERDQRGEIEHPSLLW